MDALRDLISREPRANQTGDQSERKTAPEHHGPRAAVRVLGEDGERAIAFAIDEGLFHRDLQSPSTHQGQSGHVPQVLFSALFDTVHNYGDKSSAAPAARNAVLASSRLLATPPFGPCDGPHPIWVHCHSSRPVLRIR